MSRRQWLANREEKGGQKHLNRSTSAGFSRPNPDPHCDEAGCAQRFSPLTGTFAVVRRFGLISSEATLKRRSSIGSWRLSGREKKGTNHETGKISCRGGIRDPLCRMRRGTRFREAANRTGPERCLPVRRRNVGTARTAGAQASVRARTFLDSSRGIEHGKRVRVSVQPFRLVAG
jgi:hypothetical protein